MKNLEQQIEVMKAAVLDYTIERTSDGVHWQHCSVKDNGFDWTRFDYRVAKNRRRAKEYLDTLARDKDPLLPFIVDAIYDEVVYRAQKLQGESVKDSKGKGLMLWRFVAMSVLEDIVVEYGNSIILGANNDS